MEVREVRKTYLQATRLTPPTPWQAAWLGLAGLFLSPFYCLLARTRGVPGMQLRSKCIRLGLRLLLRRSGPIDFKTIYLLLFFPLDSTRYFELDFAWKALANLEAGSYLDISSPRLLFMLLLSERKRLTADLLNPDRADLAETERLLRAAGLLPLCRLHGDVISNVPFAPASFDVITSISVLEHIPEDRHAVAKMWQLLRPGGRLVLTVPCAAETSEQYIDRDEFGVLGASADGRVFWQRFYDAARLRDCVFNITGEPVRTRIFGERKPGLFLKNATRKRSDRFYPFWREPHMVAQDYTFFDSLQDLPGEGVMAMEFIKS